MSLRQKYQKTASRLSNSLIAILFLCTYSISALLPFVSIETAAAAPVCSVDSAGANDVPGQKDLTQMCVDPVTGEVTWNWDETSVNGANTLDGCALFDTDGDGYVNRALCISTTDGVNYTKTSYTCNDSAVDRCAGADVGSPATSMCTLATLPTQPFGAGASSPNDLVATCIPSSADTAGGVLVDVCSYPSSEPNSAPSDCVMYRARSARIEVKKVVDPVTDPGLFNLKIGATTYATNVGNGGTTGQQILTSGSLTVSETAGIDTSLASYTTTVVCRDANGTGAVVGQGSPTRTSSRQLTITAADASDIVCVFTNTRQTGTVTLVKTVVNDNGGNLGANDFGLSIGETSVMSGQTVTLPAGVPVTINEVGAPGYTFTGIAGAGCPVALGGTVTPINGQNITCTITNDDQPGTLIVKKVVINDNGGTKTAQNFSFQINGGAVTPFEADAENVFTLNTGTYSVTEVADTQYTTTYSNCASVAITNGATATCTITNDDKPATLKLTKTVVNDNGGTLAASDFPVFLNGTASSWGEHTVNAGTYVAQETANVGYTPSAWSGDCSGTGSLTLLPGESKECAITNDDKPAQLSGVKYETNADGTIVQTLAGWTVCLDANANGLCDTGEKTTVTAADGSYSFTGLNVGTYTLAETNNLGGSMAGWTQIFAPQPVALTLGSNVANNNFGNFKNASIGGYKWNDNNGDGQKGAGESYMAGWTIQLKSEAGALIGTDVTDSNGYYLFDDLAPGTYTVCEVQQNGWVQTYPSGTGCHTAGIDQSGEANSLDFGNQGRGTLEIKKALIPAYDQGVFNLQVDGMTKAANVGNTGTTGIMPLPAGTYGVAELAGTATSLQDYTSSWVCEAQRRGAGADGTSTSVTIQPGENWVCTFTNVRKTGSVTVVKEVVNNNGGTAQVSDFNLYLNAQRVSSGTENTVNANVSYDVREDLVAGYQQKSVVCTLAGVPISRPFTLLKDQHVTCTIVNDDITPKLTVIKHVVNSGTSNTATAADFTMMVHGVNVSARSFEGAEAPGTTVTLDAGEYAVSEESHEGYAMTTAGSCSGQIQVGEEKTCTVTNTAVLYPGIEVIKDGPTVAHEGDTVTYTYDVTNTGNVPFPSGAIEDMFEGDETIYDPAYISGDTNDDSVLDPGETWHFELEYTVPTEQSADVKNTVEVCGYYYDPASVDQESLPLSVCDEDDHTLNVLHPGLRVVKSGPANAQNGTTASYTFTVTNTGDTSLTIGSVIDDVAGLGIYQSGDSNGNKLLDQTEVWLYQASVRFLTNGTVKNTVTVCATDVIAGKVCSQDSHETIVYTPQVLGEATPPALQDTGLNILAAAMASLAVIGLAFWTSFLPQQRRRQTEWYTF